MLATVDAVRAAHPDLQRPLTITALSRVLAREGIDVVRRPIRAYAYTEGALGTFVIVARAGLNPRHERRVLAHEYAHITLHYADAADTGEVVFQRTACTRGDPRELEAQLFVRLLELGPEATPDHSEIARFVAALDAPAIKRPLAPQMEIPFAVSMPMYRVAAMPAGSGDHGSYSGDSGRRPRDRYKGPRIKVGDSHDSLLFDWSQKGMPLGFFAGDRGWCDVWDTMSAPERTRRSRDLLACGDRRATWRDFVFSSTERFRYEFAEGERRGRSPKELRAQLARAARLAVAAPITEHLLFRARKV